LIGAGNFILLPLYTRSLNAAQFGVYSLLDITILMVVTIAQLGFGITYLKWFADLDSSRHGELLGSVTVLTLISGTLGGAALLAGAWQSPALAMAGPVAPYLLLLIVPLESLQGVWLADVRARRRSVLFCVAAGCRLSIMVIASWWFVQAQKQGIPGILIGRAIGDAVGLAMLGALCLPFAVFRFSRSLLRGMLAYGTPLIWTALVGIGFDAAGRYLLARYTTLEEVAVYTVALKIASVLQVGFLQPFGTAWSSIMFQIGRDKSASVSITRILGVAFVAGMMLAAAISVFSPTVLPLLGPLYGRSATLVPWLLLPPAFRILEYWSSAGLFLSSRTGSIAVVATAGTLLNGGGLVMLVPRLGAFGAALAWVISLSAMIAAYAWISRRVYRLTPDWRPLVLGAALWAVGSVAAGIVPPGISAGGIALAFAALLVVGGIGVAYAAKELGAAEMKA
jgi:O-antigen/teichoic acid export membrane protein